MELKHTPIQTAPVKDAKGNIHRWEATTTIGILPCRIVNEDERMAVRWLQDYIKRTTGKEAEFNDWKQTDDRFNPAFNDQTVSKAM